MYTGANQTEIKCMQICNSHCNISLHITITIVSPFPKSGKKSPNPKCCQHLRQVCTHHLPQTNVNTVE